MQEIMHHIHSSITEGENANWFFNPHFIFKWLLGNCFQSELTAEKGWKASKKHTCIFMYAKTVRLNYCCYPGNHQTVWHVITTSSNKLDDFANNLTKHALQQFILRFDSDTLTALKSHILSDEMIHNKFIKSFCHIQSSTISRILSSFTPPKLNSCLRVRIY